MNEEFRMPPNFPSSSSPSSYHDVNNDFDNNDDVPGNAFLGTPEPIESGIPRQKKKTFTSPTIKPYVKPEDKLERAKGVSELQFFHRIQAAYCHACDVLIPEVEELTKEHAESAAHHLKCEFIFSEIKYHSRAVAAEILQKINMGEKPFMDVRSPQVSGTNEVIIAEEVENNDEDAIDFTRDDPEVFVTDNESPAHETKDSDKMFLPNELEINEPPTSSVIATSCNTKHNSPAVATEYFRDEYISQILKKYRMDVAVRTPQVSDTNEVLVADEDDDTNEDSIDDARDDPEVPVTHNESPAQETKDSDKMFLPDEPEIKQATSSMTVNPGQIQEEETEEEEEAAEAP